MIAELATFLLGLSLIASAKLIFEGYQQRREGIIRMSTSVSLFLAGSYVLLTTLFLLNDFSIAYIVNNSNTELAWWYKISGVWGAHEGSILLWTLVLAIWVSIAEKKSRQFDARWRSTMFIALGIVALGFISFVVFSSNPFARVYTPFEQGKDLNPLLQDPGLIFHPPLLYLGYIGMSVPFAFSVAMVIHKHRATATELEYLRIFVLLSFAFLSCGIALGSYWAYYELGWGGWWFWDPVENASLMPWLVSIALLHTLRIAIARSRMLVWVYGLSILGFCLSVLGTFLVRSGIIVSVHSFASDPSRGIFILILIAIICIPSFTLLAMRAHYFANSEAAPRAVLSKEILMKVGVVIVLSLLFIVALGTLYPLFLELFGLGKISVGPPYFNAVFLPIATPLIGLLAFTPGISWNGSLWSSISKRVSLAALLALPVMLISLLTTGLFLFSSLLALVSWSFSITVLLILVRKKQVSEHSWSGFFNQQSASWFGMQIAHFGFLLVCIGITTVGLFSEEKEQWITVSESVSVGNKSITLVSIDSYQHPQYTATRANFILNNKNRNIQKNIYSEKRNYTIREQVTTETGIDPSFFGDTFIALGDINEDGSKAQVRLQWKPMIRYIWLGCIFFALGAFISLIKRKKAS